jgi:hypothetical protein
VARNFYYALARALGDDVNNAHNATAPRHADISMVLPPQLGGGNLRFLWAPYAANLTTRFDKLVSSSKKMPDVVVMGAGLWDALWVRDPVAFKRHALQLQSSKQKQRFVDGIARRQGSKSDILKRVESGKGDLNRRRANLDVSGIALPLFMWLDTTAVVDERLAAAPKREHMRDAIVERQYSYHGVNGNAVKFRTQLPLYKPDNGLDGVIEARAVTAGREFDSVDGVHYVDVVYDVLAQVLLNQIRSAGSVSRAELRTSEKKKKKKKMVITAAPTAKLTAKPTEAPVVEESPKTPKPVVHEICEMARPKSAFLLMVVILIMLFSMDNFFGIPTTLLRSFGSRDLNALVCWEAAYAPLHRKIGVAK